MADTTGHRANTGALAPLRVREFRFLFAGLVLGQLVLPLQFVTQIFWVQESVAEDSRILFVGVIGAMRGAGTVLFGLYAGALADRFDRRRLLLVTQSVAVAAHAVVVILMVADLENALALPAFFALTFVSAATAAVDLPTRQAIVPEVLGAHLSTTGVALSAAAIHLVSPLSIFGTGFLIDGLGFAGTYGLATALSFVAVLTLVPMRYRSRFSASPAGLGRHADLREIREGLRYVRSDSVVFWTIVVVFAMIALGYPAVANLGPTWITTVLGRSFREFGLIASAWSVAAFGASVLLTRRARTANLTALVPISALVWSASFLVFAVSAGWVFAVIGNIGLGAALAASQIASTGLIQQRVPNELRGRLMAILYLNVGVAQVLALPVAVVGQAVSLETLFPILACVEIVVVGAIIAWRRKVFFAAHAVEAS